MKHIESGIQLEKGMKVYFISEKLPMEVKAINENFAICTRKLNRRQDASLLHYQVEMSAYLSFKEAYESLKDEKVYTIIDFRKNIRGAHNLIMGGCDFDNDYSMEQFLYVLDKGDVEISYRNRCNYNLDFERTLKKINHETN